MHPTLKTLAKFSLEPHCQAVWSLCGKLTVVKAQQSRLRSPIEVLGYKTIIRVIRHSFQVIIQMGKQNQIGKWTLQGIFVGPSLGNSGFCHQADSFQGTLLPLSLFRWLTAVIGEVRGLCLRQGKPLDKGHTASEDQS